mgnify:CR=1 FL=1
MRYTLALISVVSLALTGCNEYRESMAVAPDRGGHAAGDNVNTGGANMTPVAKKNEAYYTMAADDTLYSVAKAHNVELSWLIRRNNIQATPKVGSQLVVPGRATGGGSKIK